jgi:hypothetical protein
MTNNAAVPQPLPRPGQVPVANFVIEDILARVEMGRRKYNTLLMTNNGRDALMDAYQECLDLAMYLRQTILERDEQLKAQRGIK